MSYLELGHWIPSIGLGSEGFGFFLGLAKLSLSSHCSPARQIIQLYGGHGDIHINTQTQSPPVRHCTVTG